MSQVRHWIDLTTADFAGLPETCVAILPVAAVEQHGPHLPVGTDTMINRGILAEALDGLNTPVLVLPEQTVGTSEEHRLFPGTLSHPPAELIGLWTRLLEGVVRAGVRRILLFNSHGGQLHLLQPVALTMRVQHGVLCAYASWFDAGLPDGLLDPAEARFDIHGGAIETAMMMHLRPDVVVASRIAAFPSTAQNLARTCRQLAADPGGGALGGFGWMSQDLNPYGVMGDAGGATPALGRALVGHAAAALRELIADVAGLPLSTLSPRTFLDGRTTRADG